MQDRSIRQAQALDTASSGGLLGGLLQSLIKTPGDLLLLLNTTVSTVRGGRRQRMGRLGNHY